MAFSPPLIDWEAESYPAYPDFAAIPLFVVFFLVVRFFLDRFVFEWLARKLIFKEEDEKKLGPTTYAGKRKIRKFKESAWKCMYFLSGELLALSVTYNEPWFTTTRNFWVGPGDQIWPDQKIKLKLKTVYMYVAGFYTYSIFALLFWEIRRSDFGISMTHHVATVCLIALSYIFSASCILNTISFENRFSKTDLLGWVQLSLPFMMLLMCSWSLEKFPSIVAMSCLQMFHFLFSSVLGYSSALYIIRSGFSGARGKDDYEVVLTLDKEKHKVDGPIYYYVFNSLLFSLLVLHIYWWVLMYRMLVKQIQSRGHVGDDIRSDSEGEEEHED
ncbi:ASC1-like protein 1 [Zea mays]|uniref:ASC1-like protein 1 n=1 Tax=Zea mays TaxID=4577 RepID=A0A3L6ESI5_MAIZE|nr:ASC1-like protein 1 [Zea mays]